MCKPSKCFSGSLNATTNFLTHLKRVHPSAVKDFEQHKESVLQAKRKASDASTELPEVKHKQTRIEKYSSGHKDVSQCRIDELIINYIVSGMCAIRTVETQAFKDLVQGTSSS